MKKPTGVLLINLGTPDAPTISAIRRYLFAFLRDQRVIDLPVVCRYLLVLFIILPLRPKKIKPAYQKIYSAKGSPLRNHSENLARALQQQLGPSYQVELAMRYGSPPIGQKMNQLCRAPYLKVVPLYPHYAASSTATALAEVYKEAARKWNVPELQVVPAFYAHSGFIAAWQARLSAARQHFAWDYLLFSYHGLPKRHLSKSGCSWITSRCDRQPCPHEEGGGSTHCYRWQCYRTSSLLAQSLALPVGSYGVSFQSRLGRTPWIEPFTDVILTDLYNRGVRKLAIASPSFVVDCLETLEEINIRLREQWLAHPHTEFSFVSCLNDDPQWVAALASLVRDTSLPSA